MRCALIGARVWRGGRERVSGVPGEKIFRRFEPHGSSRGGRRQPPRHRARRRARVIGARRCTSVRVIHLTYQASFGGLFLGKFPDGGRCACGVRLARYLPALATPGSRRQSWESRCRSTIATVGPQYGGIRERHDERRPVAGIAQPIGPAPGDSTGTATGGAPLPLRRSEVMYGGGKLRPGSFTPF